MYKVLVRLMQLAYARVSLTSLSTIFLSASATLSEDTRNKRKSNNQDTDGNRGMIREKARITEAISYAGKSDRTCNWRTQSIDDFPGRTVRDLLQGPQPSYRVLMATSKYQCGASQCNSTFGGSASSNATRISLIRLCTRSTTGIP